MVPQLSFIHNRKKVERTKPSVVELRISAGSVRKYISTGVKLLPKEWSNGSVVGRKDWKELNDQLQIIKKQCSEIIISMMENDNLDLRSIPSILKNKMSQKQTFLEYMHEYANRKMKDLKKGTQKRYKVVLNFMDTWRGMVYFSDVTEQNIRKMDEYLEDKGLQENSRYNYHKIVKSCIIQAFNDGVVSSNPYIKVKIRRGDKDGLDRCLTPAEFHRFETCKIDIERLAKVRDLFVFQTYTCMGYSDLEAFDYKKCYKINGSTVYKSNRIKTGREFTFILLKPALEILKKYKYKLPKISNAKYNDYLKSAVTYAKIGKNVTTHWARHTGTTILLNEGRIDMNTISKIIGDTLKETERTYAKMMDETIINSMVGYQKSFNPKRKKKGQKSGKVLTQKAQSRVKTR